MQDLKSQKLIGTSNKKGGLYVMNDFKEPTATTAATTIDFSSFHLSPFLLVFIYGILILIMFRLLVENFWHPQGL